MTEVYSLSSPDIESENLFDPKEEEKVSSSIFILYKYRTKLDTVLLIAGLIILGGFSVFPILLYIEVGKLRGNLSDITSLNDFYETEKELAIRCYIYGVITVILGWLLVVIFTKIGNRIGMNWKKAYFESLSNKSMEWFDNKNPAELSGEIDYMCNLIEHSIGDKMITFFFGIIFNIEAWTVCFIYSIELTLISLPTFLINIGLIYMTKKISLNKAFLKQEENRVTGGIAVESLEGVKTIASCNAQKKIIKRYQKGLEPLANIGLKIGIYNGLRWGFEYFVYFIFVGIIFYIGAFLLEDDHELWLNGNKFSAEIPIVIAGLISDAGYLLLSLMLSLDYINSGVKAASTIQAEIIKTKKFDGNIIAQNVKGIVEFDSVYYSYSSSTNILNGISFKVDPGKSLAIVGKTGSGKSTIIQLIEGFYFCNRGMVKIDGINIKDYDLKSLRKFISIVSQEPILFNCSIEENIKIGKEFASDEEVVKAAEKAEAHSFIESLPEKYKTWVGNKGSQLSGGQKQRIAIARALIKNPKILLLDEATSALDLETEKNVQETLNKIMKEATCVIVAQRLSTIKDADTILLLENGNIIENGNFNELISLNRRFSKMFEFSTDIINNYEKHSEEEKSEKEQLEKNKLTPITKKKNIKIGAFNVLCRILAFVSKSKLWFIATIASSLSIGILVLYFSYLLALNNNILLGLEGSDITAKSKDILIQLLTSGILLFFLSLIIFLGLERLSSLFTFCIRNQAFSKLLYYKIEFFDKKHFSPSILSAGIAKYSESASSLGGPFIALQLTVYTSLIGGIALAFTYDTVLGSVALVFLPFILAVGAKGEAYRNNGYANNNLVETSKISSDTFTNIKTVTAFNSQKYFLEKYLDLTKTYNNKAFRSSFISGIFIGMPFLIGYYFWGTVIWVGTYRFTQNQMSLNVLYIVVYSIFYNYISFVLVGIISPDIVGGIEGGKQLYTIIDNKKDTYELYSDLSENSNQIFGDIEFKNVCFSYKNRDIPVLDNISLLIPRGMKIGITGTTGSGKSTFANLLLRFYDPSSGEILLDGKNLNLYNLGFLRQNICWVGQEPLLFKGSILYNLQLSKTDVTKEEALKALRIAQASSFVKEYGLDYDVGLRGCKLSGGQKQRVCIARALIRNPKVLIFDESTSALDSITEKNVMRRILKKDLSIISIAHRLESIKKFDKIVRLEKGIIIEN